VKLRARALAFANIALIKYWGKAGPENRPATPSIALTLEALRTETTVEAVAAGEDAVELNGAPAQPEVRERVAAYLDEWRQCGLLTGAVRVSSVNHFPTAAGLASSASGYAALAVALNGISEAHLTSRQLSRLARLGSGSAARSIAGGLAALPLGQDPAARCLLSAPEVPWAMVLCLVDAAPKAVPSREGMEHCRATSPYYSVWLRQARRDYSLTLDAIRRLKQDVQAGSREMLGEVGELMEADCLAMHACMLAARPPLAYWSPATLEVIAAVRRWRAEGTAVYFTIDAGPHVALPCLREDAGLVSQLASQVAGVQRVIVSMPGGPAQLIEVQ